MKNGDALLVGKKKSCLRSYVFMLDLMSYEYPVRSVSKESNLRCGRFCKLMVHKWYWMDHSGNRAWGSDLLMEMKKMSFLGVGFLGCGFCFVSFFGVFACLRFFCGFVCLVLWLFGVLLLALVLCGFFFNKEQTFNISNNPISWM